MPDRKEWHDINEPGWIKKKTAEEKSRQQESDDTPAPKEKEKPEVQLLSASWKPGANGYNFNEECLLEIQAKYLAEKVARKRVLCRLYVVCDGEEEDCSWEAEGVLNADGVAQVRIKLVFGENYYQKRQSDPAAVCQYKCVVSNTAAEKQIESDLLDMPQNSEHVISL